MGVNDYICDMRNEQYLIQEIKAGNTRAFAQVFQHYYKDIVLFAASWLPKKEEACEDIVQEVFVNIWDNRNKLPELDSLKSYLLKAVQNRCLNYLRHMQIKSKYLELNSLTTAQMSRETEEYILYSELKHQLQNTLIHLSPLQRQCFEMNRLKGLKQAQIAEELGIPLRTVEQKIAEALKILKKHLKEYYLLISLLLFH